MPERLFAAAVDRFSGATAAIETAWSDRGYRWLTLVAGSTLWLSLALRDAAFLLPFGISLVCMWWRRRNRQTIDNEADDWY